MATPIERLRAIPSVGGGYKDGRREIRACNGVSMACNFRNGCGLVSLQPLFFFAVHLRFISLYASSQAHKERKPITNNSYKNLQLSQGRSLLL